MNLKNNIKVNSLKKWRGTFAVCNVSTIFPHIVATATILFLEVGVRQVFKGGHYLSKEAIFFFFNLENAANANN